MRAHPLLTTLAVSLALAACGGDGSETTVDITVKDYEGQPAAGITVVLGNSDGTVAEVLTTDAQGQLSIPLPPEDSIVTVARLLDYPELRHHYLATKMGVRRGNQLTFYVPALSTSPPPSQVYPASLAVTYPPSPPGTPTSYKLDLLYLSTSGETGGSFNFDIPDATDLFREGTHAVDILATASDESGLLGYSIMNNVTLASPGPTTVDFPDGWRTDFLTVPLTLQDVPAGVTQVRPALALDVFGRAWHPEWLEPTVVAPGDDVLHAFRLPQDFGTRMNLSFELETDTEFASLYYDAWLESAAAPVTVPGARILPIITGATASGTDTVRPSISWTTSAAMEGAMSSAASLRWQTSQGNNRWFVQFDPEVAGPVQVPALPDELAEFRPPTDGTVTPASVYFERADYLQTYDDARQDPGTRPETYESSTSSYSLPLE